MATPERTQLLTNALRQAASRSAELAGGGAALLFARLPADGDDAPPRLRAAAGFASLDDARQAGSALESAVRECTETRAAQCAEALPTMATRGAAGVRLLPLEIDGRAHGALAIGAPEETSAETNQALEMVAKTAAIHIDHLSLTAEVERLRVTTPPAGDADEVLQLSETLFAQDIELMRSQEKLGQIEKVKSDFMEKMSKELRTPLNSIIEAIICVLAGENENISDAARRSLRSALDEGTVFQRTLQNILDLWRIKQGEMAVEIQDLNFSEVIDEAIFSVHETLEGRPVTIDKVIGEPLPKIKADLAKVNQILFLILDNAAKFTPKGKIEIRAEVVDGMLRCQIADTGIGIFPDDQQYIFDEFYQVDSHYDSAYRGAGLGLSLARDLLGLLDGSCQIKSEPGHGTTAIFEIPIQTS